MNIPKRDGLKLRRLGAVAGTRGLTEAATESFRMSIFVSPVFKCYSFMVLIATLIYFVLSVM